MFWKILHMGDKPFCQHQVGFCVIGVTSSWLLKGRLRSGCTDGVEVNLGLLRHALLTKVQENCFQIFLNVFFVFIFKFSASRASLSVFCVMNEIGTCGPGASVLKAPSRHFWGSRKPVWQALLHLLLQSWFALLNNLTFMESFSKTTQSVVALSLSPKHHFKIQMEVTSFSGR